MFLPTHCFASLFFVFSLLTLSCSAQVAPIKNAPASSRANVGSISRIAGMTTRRSVHTATLLQNGTVLIAGGYIGGDGNTSTAEVFDPGTNSFAAVAGMAVERSSHTATLLPNGKVLIVGGFNGQYLDTTEIYDPETKRFSKVGRLLSPRSGHVATALKNGKILIAGGVGTGWTFLKSAEIYDPATNRSTAVADMSVPRESHTATVLNDGRVLITGGHRDRRSQMVVYTSTEIFDPETSRFVPSGELTIKRHKHEAVRLSDGRVLILGGSDERDGDGAYNNAEVYSPADRTFAAVKNNMNTSRYKLQGTGILLADGRVLVAGGARRAEVFDPATNSFSYAEGDLESTRLFATATLLSDGSVLITGGYRDGRNISDGAWIYRS